VSRPSEAEALEREGVLASQHGDHQAAIRALSRAVALNPLQCGPHNELGNALQRMGRFADSLLCYQEALRQDPRSAEAYNNLGGALVQLGRYQEALSDFLRAVEIKPDYADPYNNVGNVLQAQGQLPEAVCCYREALRLRPDYAEAWHNAGKAFEVGRCLKQALECYEEALRLRPDFPEAHISRAMTWLLAGNFQQGWTEYEWRWRGWELPRREFTKPQWDGSSLDGKPVLLYAEQGLGDTLQFLRYAPLARQRGVKVIVECQPRLAGLVETVEGIDRVVAAGSRLPSFRARLPLLSLPRIFGATLDNLPAPVSFRVDRRRVEAWRKRLSTHEGWKVGIAWAGNPVHRNNPYRDRSVGLAHFAPLARHTRLAPFSLQRGPEAAQLSSPPSGLKVDKLEDESTEVLDTAAAILNLDLVITVDSMVAHLAASLGKPVWVLLPFAAEWRWLLDREDSPWYPTVRLFRQPRPGDWSAVLERVTEVLPDAFD
jgi:Flp pilus assembly protein TadD